MSKAEIQKKCDDLGIKYQENDTVEQLELMIAGKESASLIKTLEDDLTKHKKALDTTLQANAELQERLEELEDRPTGKEVSFKSGKRKGRFVAKRFTLKGHEYTAEEAAKDPKLLEQLIRIKSGVIQLEN